MNDLISPEYLEQLKQLHNRPEGMGGKGDRWADMVHALARLWAGDHPVRQILDYGCGQGKLAEALRQRGLSVHGYDPAMLQYAHRPAPADIVVCTDVLEHVEPDRLDAVLADLQYMTLGLLVAVIALEPSNKTLPDGRNAHLSLLPAGQWLEKLNARFAPAPFEAYAVVPAVAEKHMIFLGEALV